MPPHDFFHLEQDEREDKTDGIYEYYYTEKYDHDGAGHLKHIGLKIPNVTDTDVVEVGIYDGATYFPIRYKSHQQYQEKYGWVIDNHIRKGEKVYAKITGTAVDADVFLWAAGEIE